MTLWCDVVSNNGSTGWHVILLTRNLCPEILVTWLTDNTWVNFDWSLSAKCQRFSVPLACFVTMATMGGGDACRVKLSSFSSLARFGLAKFADSVLPLLVLWFADLLSSSASSWLGRCWRCPFSVGDAAFWVWTEWLPGPSRCNKWRRSSMWNGLNRAKWVLRVEASPSETAFGSLELNDTWAWRKDPGVYSSSQSTNLV